MDVPNHYEFQKVDPMGNPLAGVKFALENTDGTVLRELVSDENGMVQIAGFLPGSYVIGKRKRWKVLCAQRKR